MEYAQEFLQRTSNGKLPMDVAIDRLRNFSDLVECDEYVAEFARLLADEYLNANRPIYSIGVINAVDYLKYDLQTGVFGWGPHRGQTISSTLIGLPSVIVVMCDITLRANWDKIFPEWYAAEITGHYKAIKAKMKKD